MSNHGSQSPDTAVIKEKMAEVGMENLSLKEQKDSGDSPAQKKSGSGKKAKAKVETSTLKELKPWPSYINERIELFDKLHAEHKEKVAALPRHPISITLPDGKVVEGTSWETTPYEVARGISQGLADSTVVAKVNDVLWDLDRPFEESATLQLLKFDNEEGQYVFRHSTAHMLGEAMERAYGGCLCYGPPTDGGFYYDMFYDQGTVSQADYPVLENIIKSISKEKQEFVRLEMTKADLLKMFEYNEFKKRIITERVNTPTTTVYRCGPLIDLCRGPHVRHTGKVKAVAVVKNSSTYWEGRAEAESLQRIYGISFPDPKQLKEWKFVQEEAAKRDHRKIGKEQELFFFNELSPGSCFFLPKGAHIFNKLQEFIRKEYRKRGFQEVITPNIYNSKLWETSGHWEHYGENMFRCESEKQQFGLKPMNCPGHCIMFAHRVRSWRELPLRMADFGVLHRNELSGALHGLTRVRRFQQDDAHIFCTPEQIGSEMEGCLDFMKYVYEVFGFDFVCKLSTRPEKYLGDLDTWNAAEEQLKKSLENSGMKWELNPGDGAFYGPKIDVSVRDALKRYHQCATIQLDFQQPVRFNLQYQTDETAVLKRPVIIHRAVLGSCERMFAILTENCGGKWPFWLSPRQAIVIPIAPALDGYATEVRDKLFDAGYMVDVDTDAGNTLNKKVRNAQLAQYNFILVVGENEKQAGTVNVRTRDNKVHGERAIDQVLGRFKELVDSYEKEAEEKF